MMLLDRADQAISSTDLQKNTKALLDRITSGEQDRYVVIRDNRPAAVLMPTERYEAIMNELEDLRVEALARDRLSTLDKSTNLSHAEMLAYFGKAD
ncbi:type II toxin-antitoxin system Phd/YefM family antitoxin [Caballeronia sp. KNU42]